MPDKFVADHSYSDQELLALWRECYARISVTGQSYQMNMGGGTRTYTDVNMQYVQGQIDWLERRIAAASGANGGQLPVNYATFRRG